MSLLCLLYKSVFSLNSDQLNSSFLLFFLALPNLFNLFLSLHLPVGFSFCWLQCISFLVPLSFLVFLRFLSSSVSSLNLFFFSGKPMIIFLFSANIRIFFHLDLYFVTYFCTFSYVPSFLLSLSYRPCLFLLVNFLFTSVFMSLSF